MLQTRQDLIHGLELASFILSSRQTKNNTPKIRNTCMQHSDLEGSIGHGAVIKNIIT